MNDEPEVVDGEVVEQPVTELAERQNTLPAFFVTVETGRGGAVQVAEGEPFAASIDRIANEANYGGYYRVFLNGEEILDPTEAPPFVQRGQRIAITSYDKVG